MSKSRIWVTGASSGIGFELVSVLAQKGVKVIASSRQIDNEKFSNLPALALNNIEIVQCNVAEYDSIRNAYAEITSKGLLTGLVNCAGITTFTAAIEDSVELVESIINTNLLGSIYLMKTVVPDFVKLKEGTIVNISSIAAKKVLKNSSVYSASKAGLQAYTAVLREELRSSNIKIIDVTPGATATPIWSDDALQKYSERMMKSSDVALVIADLLLNKSSVVTEEIILRPIGGDL